MNWIEVTDQTQLNDFMTNRKSIIAQDQYGNIGYVYWNLCNWIYDIPGIGYELELPGKVVRYIIL
jgi:hypothetical protein